MNRMIQKTALLFTMLMSAFGMNANPVDMRTAREVALKFMNANTEAPLRGLDDLQLVTTYNTSRGDAAFYVFNTPNGFVMVSADDCATPILGYSKEARFDMENIPVQLQDYLQGFVEEIAYGIENNLHAGENTVRQWELVRATGCLNDNRDGIGVEPLITTAWGQHYPYNLFTPNGCLTGCVATAMAQVMKFWEWPVQGTGEHSYQWNGQTLTANFGETFYDWDNMLDSYDDQATQEQREAVALLMWHCGVSVNMEYGIDMSRALLYPSSLIDYFNYSDEMSLEYRNDYTDATWKAKLKDCLDLGRPLYYIGYPSNAGQAGHAFVCDGYDSNDLFHFNMGGGYDGNYYALEALYYHKNCSAMFNIHPQSDVPTVYEINVSANNDEYGTVSGGGAFTHGDTVTLSATAADGYCFHYWEENGGMASLDPNYSFPVNFNRNLVAVYTEPVTISVSATEGGSVSGGGAFCYEECEVSAVPEEGYSFACWSENGEIVSIDANYNFIVTGETHLTAHFVTEENIAFADANVKALCVANWDNNGDGELSFTEAFRVTNLGQVFRNKTNITSFNELRYFNGLTSISDNAFSGCSNLTSLTLPNSIISIGNYAFRDCSSLTSLSFPSSLASIGSYAFYCCSGLTSLTLPDSVISIGYYAFSYCSGLAMVILPNTITSISDHAFYYCSRLTSLILPGTLASIGGYAFYNCMNLSSIIVLSETSPTVGTNSFYNVASDIPVYVPCESVESYQAATGWSAFSNIVGLCGTRTITAVADLSEEGVVIGAGTYERGTYCTVTAIPNDGYCFVNWTENDSVVTTDALYSFVVTDDRLLTAHFASDGIIGFADANVKAICVANWDTNGDGELSHGEACRMTNIGGLFRGHTEITSFDELQYFINLTSIGNNEFRDCSGLTVFTLPNSVTTIGSSAFYGCSGLTGSLAIPNSVTTIGSSAFYGCSGFTGSLTLPNSVITIGNSAFYCCSGFTGSLTIPNSVTTIGNSVFFGCSGFTGSLTLPNSVTTIGNSAFCGCSGFTGSLTIPNSVTTIGSSAFYGCSGFTGDLIIPNSVTTIGGSAFRSCRGLNGTLTLPNAVTTISNSSFYGCSGLTGSLAIPNSVTSIGEAAFYGCDGFTGGLILPNTLTSIGNSAFAECRGFTGNLTIPSSVTSIGNSAFYNCIGFMGSLTLPNSVTSIGSSAFFACTGLKGNLTLPNSITSIGSSVFAYCCFTGSLTIPNSVLSIGDSAFCRCSGLTGSLTIGSSVNSIGRYAFSSCNGLESIVVLPQQPPTINTIAFDGDTPLYVPCESVEAYQAATEWDAFSNIIGMCSSGTVSVVADPIDGGEMSGAGTYEGGTLCTVIATPNEGYCFVNWTRNGRVVSYDATYSFIVTGDCVLIARFVPDGNIVFADAGVKAICVANWDGNGDGELSYREAASVSSLGHVFSGNMEITSFEEMQYFVGLTSIGGYAFKDCTNLTSLAFPDVTSIGSYAFYNCYGLTGSLTLPNSVTSIGGYAFCNCYGLEGGLTIPDAVTSIGEHAFQYCHGITGPLIVGNSVTTIGSCAFYECNGLTSLTFGSSVTSIGNSAFSYCNGLKSMVVLSEIPPTLESSALYQVATDIPVYVPCESVEAYQTAAGWNAYSNIMGMCSSGTVAVTAFPIEGGAVSGAGTFESGAFCTVTATPNDGYCFACWTENGSVVSVDANYSFVVTGDKLLTACFALEGNIVFADANVKAICVQYWDTNGDGELSYREAASVSSLGEAFIYNWEITSFDELQYFIALSSIDDNAFAYCSSLTSVTLPNSVTSIGNGAFIDCGSLMGPLIIGNSVTSIGGYAFYYCSGLTSLSLPSSVAWIADGAFMYCNSLGSITVYQETPPALGEGVFYGLDQDIPVYVPCGTLNAYQDACGWNEFTHIHELCMQSQMIALAAGTNWCSFNVDITLDDLKTALTDVLGTGPSVSITIQSQTQSCSLKRGRWTGSLTSLDLAFMYKVSVSTDCEITVEGLPANAVEHPITIVNGDNWIAFPLSESITIEDAFVEFASDNDIVTGQIGSSKYTRGSWRGGLIELEPNRGYIYNSASTEDRIFTYPTSAK